MSSPVLQVEGLCVSLNGKFDIVNDLSFSVKAGETVSIVGESGCGKSMSALSILRLLPPVAHVRAGRVLLNGQDLLRMSNREMRRIRGNEIAMVFQEPMSSLNPLRSVGFQITEALRLHKGMGKAQAQRRAVELLETVQIPDPERRISEYPHQLSGGMRQRVMIAIALACEPKVILADEPTTALDVTIQAQIMSLLSTLREKFGTAIVLITHDMGLVAENADRVVVMYAGRKVEQAPVDEFFSSPLHPYSRGLLGSLPRFGQSLQGSRMRLKEIPGTVPALGALPPGCSFAGRCAHVTDQCRKAPPENQTHRTAGHSYACWHPQEDQGRVAS